MLPGDTDLLAYRGRVTAKVLSAVGEAGRVDGSEDRIVMLRTALAGMCDAIAMLVAASGEDRTSDERRELANLCRQQILTASNNIAAKVAAGEELPWVLQTAGRGAS